VSTVSQAQAWPAVDAVVPTRNRPELLRDAIDAILGQDYPGDIRVIVVHDQSEPDDSVADDDPHRGVMVIQNVRRPGLAGARNTGILASDRPLVAFCDDDDVWLSDKLRRQVEVLQRDPAAEFVCIGIRVKYADGSHDRILRQHEVTLSDLLRDRLVELHPSGFVMRRAAIVDGFGLVDEEIPGSYAEDYEFLLRAARRTPIRNVPEVGIEALWSQRSYFTARWATIVTALEWLLDRYPEFQKVPAGEARVSGQIAFASAAQGKRSDAVRWVGHTLRRNPTEPRAYLALTVASGAVSADAVLKRLHAVGKGI
jgi:glycosyltransferase involved in cell wall biosynthesis